MRTQRLTGLQGITVSEMAMVVLAVCTANPTLAQTSQPISQPESLYLAAMNEGHAQFARWELAAAAESFKKALEADPNSIPARFNLGLSHFMLDKYAEAVEVWKPWEPRTPTTAPGAPPLAQQKWGTEATLQLNYLLGLALLKDGRVAEAVEPLKHAAKQTPTETSVVFQYGVALQESGKAEAAAEVFRKVMEQDRFHITAPFRLARIERAAGRIAEADRLSLRSEQNRAVLGPDAAEREAKGLNKFTKPMDPPSDWQPSTVAPSVKFAHVKDGWGLQIQPKAFPMHSPNEPPAVVGVKRDEHFRIRALQFWHFTGGRYEVLGDEIDCRPEYMDPDVRFACGDFDNDGLEDVLIGTLLLRQFEPGKFNDVTANAGLEGSGNEGTFIDLDHDGDLDIVRGSDQGLRLMRNRGDGTFLDDSAAAKESMFHRPNIYPHQMAVGDVNGDDLIDLGVTAGERCKVLFNAGYDAFDSAMLPSFEINEYSRSVMIDDVNNDGKLEAAFSLPSGQRILARVVFSSPDVPRIDHKVWERAAFALFDYDNDGFLDTLLVDRNQLALWRNMGQQGWLDVSRITGVEAQFPPLSEGRRIEPNLTTADFDGDGDVDFYVDDGTSKGFWRNDTAKPNNVLRLTLEGTKSNRSAIGSRVELRAGNKRIFRNVTSPSMLIGVGDITRLDSVTVYWTNGATDAVTNVDVSQPLKMVEPQVALGSCPYLYVWDGSTFRFVTDILGASPVGLSLGGGKFVPADTDEIVWLGKSHEATEPRSDEGISTATVSKIRRGGSERSVASHEATKPRSHEENHRLKTGATLSSPLGKGGHQTPLLDKEAERDQGGSVKGEVRQHEGSDSHLTSDSPDKGGPVSRNVVSNHRVIIEITDELREILYLDRVKLLVADHPEGTEVHPTDKLMMPPFPKSELWTVSDLVPPSTASAITASRQYPLCRRRPERACDLTWIDNFRVGPEVYFSGQLRGLAEQLDQFLLFPAETHGAHPILVLTGWLQYGDASVNVAASQNPALGNPFPTLHSAARPEGIVERIDVQVGVPAGKTKTILVDLSNKLPAMYRQCNLILTSALELYWDRIALGTRGPDPVVTEIEPASAVLRYRGVSRMVKSARDEPAVPVYDDVLDSPPWRRIPEGYYTRYGDVLPLITTTDDRYVTLACGDAVRIEFDIADLPPPPEGHVRDFFLYTDGWDKDMDANVLHGHTVEPLPFHGMDDQRYGQEPYPLADDPWLWEYNTRWVDAELNGEIGMQNAE